MKKRLLWLTGATVVIGVVAGFVLARQSDTARRRTCSAQAESAASSEALALSTSESAGTTGQLPPPKLALDLGARPKDQGAVPGGLPQTAPPAGTVPALAIAAPAPAARSNEQSRALTTADLPSIRQLAKQIQDMRRAGGTSPPAQ